MSFYDESTFSFFMDEILPHWHDDWNLPRGVSGLPADEEERRKVPHPREDEDEGHEEDEPLPHPDAMTATHCTK
jgi:hypothetical protein